MILFSPGVLSGTNKAEQLLPPAPMVFFVFDHVESMSTFSQKQAEMWTFTVFRSMTSGPENSAAFLRKINKCLPLCIIQFQVAFLDAAADCVEWQWFSKVLPSPCGYVHHGSMTVSQTIPPEGSMVTCIQQQFLPLAFTHQDSPDSLNLFTILWTVDGERPKFFAILRWETLKFWTDWQFSHEVWHKVVNHDPSLLAKTKPLVDAPFILNLDNLTCYQLNC